MNLPIMPPIFIDHVDLNTQLLKGIGGLPDAVRKWMRLLAKQHNIINVYQESDELCENVIKKVVPKTGMYVIMYNDKNSNAEFKIIINPSIFDQVTLYKKTNKKKWVVIANNKF